MALLPTHARGLRLSASGYNRLTLSKAFPTGVGGYRLYTLVSQHTHDVASQDDQGIDRRTVARILERKQGCFQSTLGDLFRAYELDLEEPDVELAPASSNYALELGTVADHRWAAEIDASVFDQDAIPLDNTLAWSERNPHTFYVLRKEGIRVGYINAIPVDPIIFATFRDGKITERELPAAFVLEEEVASLATELYIAAFVTLGNIVERAHATVAIIRHFVAEILPRHYREDKLYSVCAIAATHQGESLMREHLGFRLEQAADQRKDGHSFCVASLPSLRAAVDQYLD